jgi:hypothetical protein
MKHRDKAADRRRRSPARVKAARRTAKPKTGATKQAIPSREKVRAHRARLRAKGMRPITVWVRDTRSPKFAAEARRQCRLANTSAYAAEDQAWVDSMAAWSSD